MKTMTYKEYHEYKIEQIGRQFHISVISAQVRKGTLEIVPDIRPRQIIMNESAVEWKPRMSSEEIAKLKPNKKENEFISPKDWIKDPFFGRNDMPYKDNSFTK